MAVGGSPGGGSHRGGEGAQGAAGPWPCTEHQSLRAHLPARQPWPPSVGRRLPPSERTHTPPSPGSLLPPPALRVGAHTVGERPLQLGLGWGGSCETSGAHPPSQSHPACLEHGKWGGLDDSPRLNMCVPHLPRLPCPLQAHTCREGLCPGKVAVTAPRAHGSDRARHSPAAFPGEAAGPLDRRPRDLGSPTLN